MGGKIIEISFIKLGKTNAFQVTGIGARQPRHGPWLISYWYGEIDLCEKKKNIQIEVATQGIIYTAAVLRDSWQCCNVLDVNIFFSNCDIQLNRGDMKKKKAFPREDMGFAHYVQKALRRPIIAQIRLIWTQMDDMDSCFICIRTRTTYLYIIIISYLRVSYRPVV